MWNYEKRLQYPINITTPNAKIAQLIMSQYGGPDGEIGASMRYLSQRFAAPNRMCAAVLTDVATEELGHLEMVSTMVHQLTADLSMEEIEKSGFAPYYVDHTVGIWPQAAGGIPFNACEFQSKGDVITDLVEDMAAEQKARTTYDNILRVVRDPDVCDPIRYLREREIVHFQRFGEALRITQDHLDFRNFYAFNPAFDRMGSNLPETGAGTGAGNGMGTENGTGMENRPEIPPSVIMPPAGGGQNSGSQSGTESGGAQTGNVQNGSQSGAAQNGAGQGGMAGNHAVSSGMFRNGTNQTGAVRIGEDQSRMGQPVQQRGGQLRAGQVQSAQPQIRPLPNGQSQADMARGRSPMQMPGYSGGAGAAGGCANMSCGGHC